MAKETVKKAYQDAHFLIFIFGDNLAYKKPTWQIPSISIYLSERVVDNQRSAAGNQCAISDGTLHRDILQDRGQDVEGVF